MTRAGASSPSPNPGREGGDQRHDTLFITRTDWVLAAVFVSVLVVLLPFTFVGYELAGRILYYGIGFLMGFSAAELIVRSIGRRRRVGGTLMVLAGAVWLVGLLLLFFLPYEGWRSLFFESGDRTPLYLFVGGFVGAFANAGVDLFWGPSTLQEAREQRRYYLRQELKTFLVVVGALAAVFGFLFTLYVLGAYVLSPVLRYFL